MAKPSVVSTSPVSTTPVSTVQRRITLPLLPAARLGSSTWLLQLRAFAVAGQLITILLAGWGTGIELLYAPLIGLVLLTAITNVVYGVWLRRFIAIDQSPSARSDHERDVAGRAREPQTGEQSEWKATDWNATDWESAERDRSTLIQSVALGLMLLDLATLTAMLYFSGGAANPFSFFYFVNLAVGGVMIRPTAAWSLTVVATFGYAIILRWYVPVEALGSPISPSLLELRTLGLMFAFTTCASVVTYFVTRTSGMLRERERQLRETELAQAADRRLEALTTLAAGAAHELATPLSTIDVVARELGRHLEGVEKPATVDQDLQLIDHQLDLCRFILQRMRGAAGDSMAPQWYQTSVGDLIDATLEGIRDPHRVDVQDGTEEVESQTLWMPEEAVAQAIRNLIHNGLDASGADGRVQLDFRIVDDKIRIIVSDQGQGMTDDILGRVGDPFFTTKEPGRGIGLGLYLTRNVVSQLGGQLTFETKPDQGTSAVVMLPLGKPI